MITDFDQWWEDRLESEVRDIALKIQVPFKDLMQPWDDLPEDVQDKVIKLME